MEAVPKYLTGLHGTAVEHVAMVAKLTETVDAFRGILLREPVEDEGNQPYSGDAASREFRKQRHMQEGLTESDAEIRADADDAATLTYGNPVL